MLLFGVLLFPLRISASDLVEEAAVGIGVTAGNLWFVPIKAIAVVSGMVAGGLSYVFFGGDAEMATQIWEDTAAGPYLITPEVVQPIFVWLRQAADYVIIDTPPCFNDNVLAVLDETDELYLVATLDLPSLKNIKVCLQTLKLLGFPKEKMRLVLNRVDRNLGLSPAEVEAVFQEKISVQIPNDPAVPQAVNKGVPVVIDAPKAPAAAAILRLSDEIAVTGKQRKKVTIGVPA